MPKSTGPTTLEDKISYIFTVLKYTELPQPNYKAVANETGQSCANSAQKKFKAYVEQAGFKLVDRQVIGKDGNKDEKTARTSTPSPSGSAATPTASKSKKSAAKSTTKRSAEKTPTKTKTRTSETGRSAKKRKLEDILEISDDEEPVDSGEGEENSEVKREDTNREDVDDTGVDNGTGTDNGTGNDANDANDDSDNLDADEDGDRFRRSRARSMTVNAEAV